MFDARTILDQAAEIAGHSDPKALQPYLTRAMKEEVFRRGEVVHVEEAGDAKLLRDLAEALNSGDTHKVATLRKMLAMTVERINGPG